MSRTRPLSRALAVTALAFTLASCGSGGDGSGGAPASAPAGAPSEAPAAAAPAVTKDDALAAMVPAAVSADGKIVFGTDASYPPNEFTDTDGNTDHRHGTSSSAPRSAQKLGLTAEFQNSAFSGIIPGIAGAKYELGMSSFSINDERVQTVDMVSYFSAGTSLAVKSGNPDGIKADDLCGKAVGVQAGTVQVDDVAARNTQCTTAGQGRRSQVSELQAQTDVTLALTANRVVAMLADSPVAAYAAKTTERRGGGGRRAVRHRAVRHRAGQEPGRLRQGPAGRGAVADRRRHLRQDPGEVGRRRPAPSRRPSCAADADVRRPDGRRRDPGQRPPSASSRSKPSRSGTRGGGWRSRCSPCWARCSSTRCSTNDGFSWTIVGQLPVRRPGAERAAQHADPDRAVDGHRDRRRHRAGGDAAVPEPGARQRGRGLHLAVPRHAADRPAAVLELPGRALPDALARHPVRTGARLRSTPTS